MTKKGQSSIKVSIVVPIYNVEGYLRTCLDSILAQTLHEIEIILVDDGSPDKCPQIIDEYAAKDSRIVAVHQENGGYGKAVNHGFDLARGEYVGIVESDDFIEPEMYEMLYIKAKKYDADVSKGSFYDYDENSFPQKREHDTAKKYLRKCPQGVFKLENFPQLLILHPSIWSMIYKRDFLLKNKLRIVETKSNSYQDIPFSVQVYVLAKKIVCTSTALYNWRYSRPGNSSTANDEKMLAMIEMFSLSLKTLRSLDLLGTYKEEIFYQLCKTNIDYLHRIKWQFKAQYFDAFREQVLALQADTNFRFKYFDHNLIKTIRRIWDNDLFGALHYYRPWPVVRRSLISKRLPTPSNSNWQICILGIQIGTTFDHNLYSWWYIKIP